MLNLDNFIILFFNGFARSSAHFDFTLKFISENNVIKGGLLMLVYWWLWFRKSEQQEKHRQVILVAYGACFLAIVIARALVVVLPFRLRPMHAETLDFVRPVGMELYDMSRWSSFPSDHAVLFFTLAIGLFYISRRIGWLAFFYVSFFVAFPRVYLGLHYPTDIVAGLILAVIIILISFRPFFLEKVVRPVFQWSRTHQEYFYPIFFFYSYQIADLFGATRNSLEFLWRLINL